MCPSDFLLSRLRISVPFHPQINPSPTLEQLRKIYPRFTRRRLCGLGSRCLHWRRHVEVAKWLGHGEGTFTAPSASLPGCVLNVRMITERLDFKIMVTMAGGLLIVASLLMCCVICLSGRVTRALKWATRVRVANSPPKGDRSELSCISLQTSQEAPRSWFPPHPLTSPLPTVFFTLLFLPIFKQPVLHVSFLQRAHKTSSSRGNSIPVNHQRDPAEH